MSIVSCPRCGDKVSLPPSASPTALVQCPLCCEEYYLSDALIQLPPMLLVVGGHAAAAEKDADYRLAEPIAAAVSQAAFDTGVSTSAARPQLRTVSRPRRPEKSAVGEIVKVVLGGAAGLAGGLLVLWWLFGVDVGELGPKVSKVDYLRFLVPEKLWDQSVRSGENAAAPLEPLDDAKQTAGNGKKNATTGTGQVAGQPAQDRAAPASGDNDDRSGDQTKKADPLLTFDDLGAESSPPPTGSDLSIDDPLSTIEAPKKKQTPKTKEDQAPSEPAADEGKEKDAEPQPANGTEENAPEPPPAKSKAPDEDLPAAKEKGTDEKSQEDKPAGEPPVEEQKPAIEEAQPEQGS
jgi:hypothetical protein